MIWRLVVCLLIGGCTTLGDFIFTDGMVVFEPERAAEFSIYFTGIVEAPVESYWQPNAVQIYALERAAASALNESFTLQDLRAMYLRQYFGAVHAGERYIYGIYFCTDVAAQFPDWREEMVMVMDGGDCFVDLVYNVDAAALVWLSVHGEA